MAKITNIKPAYFLGSLLTNPKVLGSKVAEIIKAITEKGTVTQSTSISTGVTVNAQSGVITTVSLTTAPGTISGGFTVTNNKCFSNSVVLVNVVNGGTGLAYSYVTAVNNGSFAIYLKNISAAPLDNFNSALAIHFTII
jgi:uncharacterized protein YraI